MEPYYYSQMTKIEKRAYTEMKAGFTALAPSFSVVKLEGKELGEIFFKLRLDCPEIFYGVGFKYRFYPGGDTVEVIPEYLFDKGKMKEHQKAMTARVTKLVRQGKDGSEWEKLKYVHDLICENVRYDKLKKAYSHEIIGPLGQGVGVCEGIAKAVKILCDGLGIWCMIAISNANPEKKIKYRHAWNIVRLDGKYYHLDATFDNSLGGEGEIRYDYFCLDDKRIFRDHEPVMYPAPVCSDGEHFYYKEKKLSFTKMEDVGKRALQAAKKKRTLVFHWRGGYLTREVLEEILKEIDGAAQAKGCHARVGVNWPQAVLRVSFAEELRADEVVMEDANEGERIEE